MTTCIRKVKAVIIYSKWLTALTPTPCLRRFLSNFPRRGEFSNALWKFCPLPHLKTAPRGWIWTPTLQTTVKRDDVDCTQSIKLTNLLKRPSWQRQNIHSSHSAWSQLRRSCCGGSRRGMQLLAVLLQVK